MSPNAGACGYSTRMIPVNAPVATPARHPATPTSWRSLRVTCSTPAQSAADKGTFNLNLRRRGRRARRDRATRRRAPTLSTQATAILTVRVERRRRLSPQTIRPADIQRR
jgi:hypothetical protein